MENNINDDKFLKYICVEGLNGFLKHEITLKENGITIIHGPNGCGKTTLLDMIISFYHKDYSNFLKVDFNEFILIHSDINKNDNIIKINKIKHLAKDFNNLPVINIKARGAKKFFKHDLECKLYGYNIDFYSLYVTVNQKQEFITAIPIDMSIKDDYDRDERNLRRKIYNERIRNIYQEVWFDKHDIYLNYSNKDIYNNFFEKIRILDKYSDLFKFFMVKTQRLIYLPDNDESEKKNFSRFMIERYAKDLSHKIASSLAESNEKTASHDKSFPERLIQNINSTSMTPESESNIREKYKKTQDKITKILNAGLLFREKNISLPDDGLNNENVKTVLSLYLQDLNEKLAVYDDLLNKIESFQEIVGNKINNKDLHIQYDKGFYFTSKYGDKAELKLSELSSGEQHQIVLFYELIFLAETGTYYLIDEQEISLHVDWQRSFLDDISRVEKLRGHKFIIATHSPQIIGSKRSLCVALDGGIL
jgi:predicted ATP-binding protein involved in virulence